CLRMLVLPERQSFRRLFIFPSIVRGFSLIQRTDSRRPAEGNGPQRSSMDMLDRSRRTQSAHRINVMLLCIVVAFALCWLPLTVFNTLFDWHHQALPDCQHNAVFSACHLTAMARCRCGGGPAEVYESFPLSTVGSEGTTKNTSMNRMGSVCVLSPKLEISSALRDKTIPANTRGRSLADT
ncbi:hypothetical protein KUCAC02_037714, partial [Chaenocephalus aceratus]